MYLLGLVRTYITLQSLDQNRYYYSCTVQKPKLVVAAKECDCREVNLGLVVFSLLLYSYEDNRPNCTQLDRILY